MRAISLSLLREEYRECLMNFADGILKYIRNYHGNILAQNLQKDFKTYI